MINIFRKYKDEMESQLSYDEYDIILEKNIQEEPSPSYVYYEDLNKIGGKYDIDDSIEIEDNNNLSKNKIVDLNLKKYMSTNDIISTITHGDNFKINKTYDPLIINDVVLDSDSICKDRQEIIDNPTNNKTTNTSVIKDFYSKDISEIIPYRYTLWRANNPRVVNDFSFTYDKSKGEIIEILFGYRDITEDIYNSSSSGSASSYKYSKLTINMNELKSYMERNRITQYSVPFTPQCQVNELYPYSVENKGIYQLFRNYRLDVVKNTSPSQGISYFIRIFNNNDTRIGYCLEKSLNSATINFITENRPCHQQTLFPYRVLSHF